MIIEKKKLYNLIDKLPEEVDIEEIMYRLYMLEKISMAERDVTENKLFSEEQVEKEISQWFN